jgi:hypothetical protein
LHKAAASIVDLIFDVTISTAEDCLEGIEWAGMDVAEYDAQSRNAENG